jgi:hypothetical protein
MKILISGLLVGALSVSLRAETASLDAYFPMTEGFEWVYDTTHKTKKEKFEMRVRISEPWKEKGESGMIMVQRDKRGVMREFLTKSDKGIFIYKLGLKKSISPEVDTKFTPPVPRVIAPLEPGNKVHWEGRLKVAWVDKKIIFDGEVQGFEEIEVPAGKFKCIKLFYHEKRGDEVIDETAWYAEGVGQVKYDGGEYIKELKSYKTK